MWQIRRAVKSLVGWSQKSLRIDDLESGLVNAWIDHLLGSQAPSTVWGKRKDLLTVWRWAFEMAWTDVQPVRIKQVKLPTSDPVAWSIDDMRRIVESCKTCIKPPKYGIRSGDWLRAFALVVYSSGLRLTPALSLRFADLRDDGTIQAHWVTQKTKHTQTVRLSPAAVAACRELHRVARKPSPYLLAHPWSKRVLWRHWKAALTAAGIDAGRRTGPQMLRRTAATWVEVTTPGAATRFLGHRSPELAAKHYVDARFLPGVIQSPPEL